jgi:hypothetical protein
MDELDNLNWNNLILAFRKIRDGKIDEVKFDFAKTDGTVRSARATIYPPDGDKEVISAMDWNEDVDIISFFDLDVNEWRCCRKGSIIEITGWN